MSSACAALFGLRGDGAEESELVLLEQLDRAIRERIALAAPDVPSYIGMNVFGVEADGFQNANRLGKNLVADAIAGMR